MYLAGSGVLLRRQAGILRRTLAPAGQGSWDGRDLAGMTLEWPTAARSWPRRPLNVYVGSALCKFLVVALPAELRNDAERRAAGGAQMCHQLGLSSAEWVFALDTGEAREQTIVCGIPRALIAQLQAFAAARKLTLTSIRPFVSAVWNACWTHADSDDSKSGDLIVVENDAFTVFASTMGKLRTIGTLVHRGEEGLIDREVRRIVLAAGMDAASIRIALPNHLEFMAPASSTYYLRGEGNCHHALYRDFRDLALAAPEGAA
jgi:hypothetical protein